MANISKTIVYHIDGLNYMECSILSFLLNNKDNLNWTINYITERYDLFYRQTKRIIDNLKEKGYINYTSIRNRTTKFELTDKSKELLEQIEKEIHESKPKKKVRTKRKTKIQIPLPLDIANSQNLAEERNKLYKEIKD